MSSRAPIGYLAINEIPVAINQGFIAMKPTKGIPALFLLQWAKEHMEQIKAYANGSTFLEINKSNFRSLYAVIPTKELLSEYIKVVAPMYQAVVNAEHEIRVLTTLRDNLLPQLLAGKVPLEVVPDAR